MGDGGAFLVGGLAFEGRLVFRVSVGRCNVELVRFKGSRVERKEMYRRARHGELLLQRFVGLEGGSFAGHLSDQRHSRDLMLRRTSRRSWC